MHRVTCVEVLYEYMQLGVQSGWMVLLSSVCAMALSSEFGPQTGSAHVPEVCIGSDPGQQCLSALFIPLR